MVSEILADHLRVHLEVDSALRGRGGGAPGEIGGVPPQSKILYTGNPLRKVYGASAGELSAPYRIKRDNYT